MSPTMTSRWVKMRFSRLSGVFLLILFSSLGLTVSQSFPTGVGESANNGCLCHGGAANSTETTILGLPTIFESNEIFNLTLLVESSVQHSNESQGGFRLLVSGGEIQFANSSQTQELENGWTHTAEGNTVRSWNFSWTSPSDNSTAVEFVAYGNAVNGNENSMGDKWDGYGVTVPGSTYAGELIQPNVDQSYSLTDYSIILAGLIAILGFFYVVVK